MLKFVNIISRRQSLYKVLKSVYKQNCTRDPSQHYAHEQFGHVVLLRYLLFTVANAKKNSFTKRCGGKRKNCFRCIL